MNAFNERFTKIDERQYTNFEKTNKEHFPVNIPLDYDFGYLIGAYLANGCLSDNIVLNVKNDLEYFKPIKEWCNKYEIDYIHPIRNYDNPNR